MKSLIKVGYSCNNNCVFCHSAEHRSCADLTTEQVRKKIDRCAAAGRSMVVFSGGEPTIRRDLLLLAEHVHRAGLGLGLVTNGRMLAYPKLLGRLVDLGLRYVYVSLHGDRPTHDAMVRAPAHGQTLAAVDGLARLGLRPTVNCVVTRLNLGGLRALVDELGGMGPLVVKFSMVEAKGSALASFDAVVPRVDEAAAAIADAIGHARRGGLVAAHDGTPFCLLPGLVDCYDDLVTNEFADMSEAFEDDFYPVDDRNRIRPGAVCGGCALATRCPGLYVRYAERRGAGELRPVDGTAQGR